MTIRETLVRGTGLLTIPCPQSHIDTPALDAALLMAETLDTNKAELIIRGEENISDADSEKFFRLLERRRGGECVAYILGRREFRGLSFIVNYHVLVPRPDSETLIEAALEHIDLRQEFSSSRPELCKSLSVLDLCTGSGALAISLKNERPFLSVTASDISSGALDIAVINAARLLDAASVSFIKSDLFKNITRGEKFNIIISNPPYVPSGELESLSPEIRREPRIALDGGGDGLELIQKIILQAPLHLHPHGLLLLEADTKQMPAIRTILENRGFGDLRLYKDLAGRERVISAEINS